MLDKNPDILKEIYKDEYGYVAFEFNPDLGAVIHVEIYKWSKDALKKHILPTFEMICREAKDQGIYVIYAPIDNKKLEKFAIKFGFDPSLLAIIRSNGKYVPLMKKLL